VVSEAMVEECNLVVSEAMVEECNLVVSEAMVGECHLVVWVSEATVAVFQWVDSAVVLEAHP